MLAIFRRILFVILILDLLNTLSSLYDVNTSSAVLSEAVTLNDPHLKAEVIFSDIKFPTSMAFLGNNDILVLEKNNGTVQRIINGTLLPKPLLDVNVANRSERGMLGIAVTKHENHGPTYVFLYFTESAKKDGDDVSEGIPPLGNRLYRYELINNKFVNPKLLLDLPAIPGPDHNAGKIVIGPDDNVYVVIGDMEALTKSQNIKNGSKPDGTGGILRITQDGKTVGKGIFGNNYPLNLYYAYGIRNSFGIDFDRTTGKLWDTESGPYYGDEINMVDPGFNSGWKKVQGVWKDNEGHIGGIALHNPPNLVDLGKGKYSMPELSWNRSVGLTDLCFFDSNKLGKEYENDLFVGDFHYGYIYHFKLNKDRTKLDLKDHVSDKIADTQADLQNVIFGQGFGGITDIQLGPDGYLYALSIRKGGPDCYVMKNITDPCVAYSSGVKGKIFRIVPVNTETN